MDFSEGHADAIAEHQPAVAEAREDSHAPHATTDAVDAHLHKPNGHAGNGHAPFIGDDAGGGEIGETDPKHGAEAAGETAEAPISHDVEATGADDNDAAPPTLDEKTVSHPAHDDVSPPAHDAHVTGKPDHPVADVVAEVAAQDDDLAPPIPEAPETLLSDKPDPPVVNVVAAAEDDDLNALPTEHEHSASHSEPDYTGTHVAQPPVEEAHASQDDDLTAPIPEAHETLLSDKPDPPIVDVVAAAEHEGHNVPPAEQEHSTSQFEPDHAGPHVPEPPVEEAHAPLAAQLEEKAELAASAEAEVSIAPPPALEEPAAPAESDAFETAEPAEVEAHEQPAAVDPTGHVAEEEPIAVADSLVDTQTLDLLSDAPLAVPPQETDTEESGVEANPVIDLLAPTTEGKAPVATLLDESAAEPAHSGFHVHAEHPAEEAEAGTTQVPEAAPVEVSTPEEPVDSGEEADVEEAAAGIEDKPSTTADSLTATASVDTLDVFAAPEPAPEALPEAPAAQEAEVDSPADAPLSEPETETTEATAAADAAMLKADIEVDSGVEGDVSEAEPETPGVGESWSLPETPAALAVPPESDLWASGAPTPVERDDVVLEPSSLFAAETIAALDAEQAGVDVLDDATQSSIADAKPTTLQSAPVEESAPADEPVSEQPLLDLSSEDVTAHTADDAEAVPEAHSIAEHIAAGDYAPDVSAAVAGLEEVPTPQIDLDAETPGMGLNEDPFDQESSAPYHEEAAVIAPLIAFSDESGAPAEHEAPTQPEDQERPPSRPWTPSYSVRSQGPGMPAAEETSEEPADAEAPTLKRSASTASLNAAAAAEEPERPKTPWTPSYTVTNQGPADDADVAELDALEPLPAAVRDTVAASEVTSEDTAPPASHAELAPELAEDASEAPPAELAVDEGSANDIAADADTAVPEVAMLLEGTQLAAPAQEDRPKSPWTPSYSVTVQDSRSTENLAAPAEEVESPDAGAEDAVAPQTEQDQVVEDAVSVEEGGFEEDIVPSNEQDRVYRDDISAPDDGLSDDGPSTEQEQVVKDEVPAEEGGLEGRPVPPVIQVDEEAEVPRATEEETEQRPPSRPWTPSYSVTRQDPSAAQPALADDDDDEDFVPPKPLPSLKRSVSTTSLNIPVTPQAEDDERPKSPWTPSYSVTQQQRSAQDEQELESLEQLPPLHVASEVAPETASEDTAPPSITAAGAAAFVEEPATIGEVSAIVDAEETSEAAPSIPSVVVDESADQIAQVEPSTESADPERPRTPWTPSYSVSRQGSGEQENQELAELEQLPAPITEALPEAVGSKLETPADAERPPSRPWTPSYSVTNQRSGEQVPEPAQEEEAPAVAAVAAAAGAAVVASLASALAISGNEERPASRPWTPSYSVTNQNAREPAAQPVQDDEEVAKATDVAPPAPSLSVAADEDRPPSRPWTPSYSVTNQSREHAAEPVQDEEAVEAKDVAPPAQSLSVSADEDRPPSRPWTPSYSVTHQRASEEPAPEEVGQDEKPAVTAHDVPPVPSLSVAADEDRPPSRPWTPSYSVTHQRASEEPAELAHEQSAVAETPQPTSVLAPADAEQDRPHSRPWTPSYSVTHQSREHAAEPVQVEEAADAKDFAPPAPSLSVAADEDRPPSRPWTPSYSVTHQRASEEPAELAHEEQSAVAEVPQSTSVLAPADADHDRPRSRPWTPSYSVTNSGTAEQATEPVEDEQPATKEATPSAPTLAASADNERPVSRPWTPSYSVTRSGTGEEPEEPLEDTQPAAAEVTPSAPALTTSAEEERPASRPWTPSYSVSSQGAAGLSAALESESANDAAVDIASKSVPSVVAHAPEALQESSDASANEIAAEGETSLEGARTPDIKINDEAPVMEQQSASEIERPKSPWTPSYSVSTLATIAPETAAAEPASTPAQSSPSLAATQDAERPKSPWTPSYTVTQLAPEETKELDQLDQLPPAAAHTQPTSTGLDAPTLERKGSSASLSASGEPKTPWTPSYSVTSQGPGGSGEDAAELDQLEQLPEPATFPSEQPGTKQPELTPLAAVATTEPRARKSSATSSRFFPGGWFSSPQYDDNDDDLLPDTAQSDAVGAGQTAAAAAPETEERKRWCVVM